MGMFLLVRVAFIVLQYYHCLADVLFLTGDTSLNNYKNELITDNSNVRMSACSYKKKSINEIITCWEDFITAESTVLPPIIFPQFDLKADHILSNLINSFPIPTINDFEEIINCEIVSTNEACLMSELAFQHGVGGFAIIYDEHYAQTLQEIYKCQQKFHPSFLSIYTIYSFIIQEDNITAIQQATISLKLTSCSAFIVLCSATCISQVFSMARKLDMVDKRHVWILSHLNHFHGNGKDQPHNVIAVDTTTKDPTVSITNAINQSMTFEILIEANYTTDPGILIPLPNTLSDGYYPQSLTTSKKQIIAEQLNNTRLQNIFSNVDQLLKIYAFKNNYWIAVGEGTANSISYFYENSVLLTNLPKNTFKRFVRIVTILDPPYTMLLSNNAYDNVTKSCYPGHICHKISSGKLTVRCCVGFIIDLLELILKEQQWQVYLYIVEDSTYGSYIPAENRWTGLVGDLVKNKADMVLAPLTITEKRSEVISYTMPYMMGGLSIVTLAQKHEVKFINFEFLQPLKMTSWAMLLAMILVVSLVLVGSERRWGDSKHPYDFRESITYLAGLAFQRDIGGENPRYLGTRVIAIATAMGMLIIMSTYTAVLTANKVQTETELPITGFHDLKITNPDSRFTYGTINNSAFTEMFRNSHDSTWNAMYHFMKPYNFVDSDLAIQRLKDGSLDAIIHDHSVLHYYISKDKQCEIKFAGDTIQDGGLGLATQKNSPLYITLTIIIQRFIDEDVVTQLQSKWMSSSCVNGDSPEQANADQLAIIHFGGLVISAGSLIIFSIIILLFEKWYYYKYLLLESSPSITTTTETNA